MSGSKTSYTKKIIDDYCVVDTETTRFSLYHDDIIEIGILKARNNAIVKQYQQLIRPNNPIPSNITSLTGITNGMVWKMPSISEVKNVLTFIGDDIILGHNTFLICVFLQLLSGGN